VGSSLSAPNALLTKKESMPNDDAESHAAPDTEPNRRTASLRVIISTISSFLEVLFVKSKTRS